MKISYKANAQTPGLIDSQYNGYVELSSDDYGNAIFTSTVTVWGESLPYTFPSPNNPIINQCNNINFEIINDTVQPAIYQLSGLLNNCNIGNTPYFQLCFSNIPIYSDGGGSVTTSCSCPKIYFLDDIDIPYDTIYFDTIVKPTKCLAESNGLIEINNISTYYNIYPVFFAHNNDTLVWNGNPSETIVFSNLDLGNNTIYYWNAFCETQSIVFEITEAWDFTLSGNITSSITYANQTIAVGQISLDNAVSLTFNNCTIYTAYNTYTNIDQTQWTVNKNSKIRLNNTIVQSGCPQKWKGITVEGTTLAQQIYNESTDLYNNHGYVVITKESVIADAKKAVYLKPGGVVNSQDSFFKNNEYAIYFDPYFAPVKPIPENKSKIIKNEFIIDTLLYTTASTGNDIYQNSQVYIDGSRGGVNLLGNKFYYNDNTVHPISRGNAIYATNSSVFVKSYNSNSSIINGFETGFKSQTGIALRKVSITNSILNNNAFAIDIRNHIAPIIENNTIDSKNLYVCTWWPCIIPLPCAIYLEACDQYSVKLNKIKNGCYGAYIRNSGENYNQLYKNIFDSIVYSAIANLSNSNFVIGYPFSGGTGLEIKCNDFDHFSQAISVTGNMQQSQGSPYGGSSALAGNRFYTSTSTHPEREFMVSTTDPTLNIPWYDYYHHNNALCIPYWRTIPKVILNPMPYQFIETTACPDNSGAKASTKTTSGLLFEQFVVFDDSISNVITSKEAELQQLVDAGNTLLLKLKAMTMNAENYVETIEVLNLNGLLSDEVVLELMQNTMVPSAAKTIALINNSPLPQKGKDKIDEMTDVDESLREILKQYQIGKNTREIKEIEIRTFKNKKKKNISNLIKYIANEDDIDLINPLIEFLESQNTVEDYKLALQFSLTDNNYHKADEILSVLSQVSQTMDINKKSVIENYIQLQSIAISAELNNEFYDSIINLNANFLFAMASDTLIVESTQAQILLEKAGLAEYPPVVYPPIIDCQKSVFFDNSQRNNNKQNFVKIYPNPSKDILFVEYFNFDKESDKTIYLFSESGKILNSYKITKDFDIITINTRNLAPGIYLLKLNDCVEKFTKM